MKISLPGLLVLSVLAVSACSTDSEIRRQEYLDADYYTRLELPPDLTLPDASKEVVIPQPTEDAKKHFLEATEHLGTAQAPNKTEATFAATTGVAIPVEGVQVKHAGGRSWLEVPQSPGVMWNVLQQFWQHEGIAVRRAEKSIGIMETDWVSKYQAPKDAGFFERAFSNWEPERVDRFTVEIEQGASEDVSKVFFTHAGLELSVEDDDINWRGRASEPALEVEMMKRLALFVGADQTAVKAALKQYQPFASRVVAQEGETEPELLDDTDNETVVIQGNDFVVAGNLQQVWHRTTDALDNMAVDIIEQDQDGAMLQVAINRDTVDVVEEERDELSESSWLMQLFTSKGDEEADRDEFVIRFYPQKQAVRVQVIAQSDSQNEVYTAQFVNKLKQQLQ